MTDAPSLLVLYGSVRSERQGIGLARLIRTRATGLGHEATLVDPLDHPLPMLDRMYKEYGPGEAPEAMRRLAGLIEAADGVIVVSAEYNHAVPPALKNLLDTYLEEWFHKPSAIVGYSAGRFGGVRAAMQLRVILPEIGMPTASTILGVPEVSKAVTAEGEDRTDWLTGAVDALIGEVGWRAAAAKAHRAANGPPF